VRSFNPSYYVRSSSTRNFACVLIARMLCFNPSYYVRSSSTGVMMELDCTPYISMFQSLLLRQVFIYVKTKNEAINDNDNVHGVSIPLITSGLHLLTGLIPAVRIHYMTIVQFQSLLLRQVFIYDVPPGRCPGVQLTVSIPLITSGLHLPSRSPITIKTFGSFSFNPSYYVRSSST